MITINKKKYIKLILILTLIFAVIIITLYTIVFFNVYVLPNRRTVIEKRIISTVNLQVIDEGECIIDLDDIFNATNWDTVSIFVSGNRQIIKDELLIDIDIADSGIVFFNRGKPVLIDTAVYDFVHNSNDEVSYTIPSEDENNYFISMPRENSTVHVTKYRDRHGNFKYIVTFQ